MKEMKVRVTLLEDILGTLPGDPEIYKTYIASKAPDAATKEQEVADFGTDQVYEKGVTVFARDNDKPFLYDYLIKGFFKNACSALRESTDYASNKLTSYKKKIDNLVFVFPRKIFFDYEGEITICERPLRAQTPQGERVAIVASETIPAGTSIEFTVKVIKDEMMKYVIEWLDYGCFNGLGQWHNSGKGRFEWQDITDPETKKRQEKKASKKEESEE